ncbi:MAG: insulinase family protein, partial [Chloroflexota bacterium]|nr:insulinase family protein [Chloroflexota bacterium]
RPAEENQIEPRLRLQFKETEQAHLYLGLPGLERDHPDRFVLSLLSCILGEGMSSRLFSEVRERLGLAYSVGSSLLTLRDAGMVGVYAGVDSGRIAPAIEAILGECEKLKREEVPAEELVKAKEFVKGRLALQMEDTASVAAWFGQQELLSAEVLTMDEAFQAVDAVTTTDIQRIAGEILREEKLNLAVVGPFREEGDLGKLLRLW